MVLRKGALYEDSHPTKLLETMAASRPVIVAADGLAPRIVEASGGGYVAPAEDPERLARAIEACRRDSARAARGAAARAYVERHYERGALLDPLANFGPSRARHLNVRQGAVRVDRRAAPFGDQVDDSSRRRLFNATVDPP